MAATCHGNQPNHCCHVPGQTHPTLGDGVCPHLVENVNGRRWACGLMVEHGSWDLVHADPRYAPIQAEWDTVGIESCGAWGPGTNQCCYAETPVEVT